jgi:hypothetical protein
MIDLYRFYTRLSVCPSVHKVLRTFFRYVHSYWIETLYMALYQWLADQVQKWLLSTNFYKSYAPWGILQFSRLFSLWLQIFTWYMVHCFAIPRYRSSVSLVSIHWFFMKLWPLDLEKYHELSVFRTFFSLHTDIHLIFGTLLCHTKIQIKFEFGFDLLIFNEVIALGLRKISRIISFPDFFSLCLQILI